MHGLGGIGKTALATAIAHAPETRERFRDGIFWATLGQDPNILSHLTSWIQALGDRDYRPTTRAAATSYLRTLLYSSSSLLIVDDVWDSEHVSAFLAGGPSCRLLITTRRAQVADELGAQLCSMDAMTQDEAVELLHKRVSARRGDKTFSTVEIEHAASLARETGYLPLAIELMGALVARGYGWDEARNSLRLEQTRSAKRATYQHRAQWKLEACLQVSLKWLRSADQQAWESFVWLGVLPNDITINPKMAAILWQLPESEAGQLLNSLADDSILQRRGISFSIHDLMQEMARHLLITEQPEGLGFTHSQAHSLLLGRYASQVSGSRWDKLPDDSYIHSRLLWHFEQCGDHQAIHDLLRLRADEGQHAWYAARDQLGQAAGFIADVATGWRLVKENGQLQLGRQCRYALIIASLHSLAQLISPKLLYLLVRHNVWTPTKALDHVRRMVEITRRAEALTQLIPILLEQGKETENGRESQTNLLYTLTNEAQAAITAGVDGIRGAELLAALAQHYAGNDQAKLIQQAIRLIESSPELLRHLATTLPGSFRDIALERACEACQQMDNSAEREINLARLIREFSTREKREKWTRVLQEWTDALGSPLEKHKKDNKREPEHSSKVSSLKPSALSLAAPFSILEEKTNESAQTDPRLRVIKFCLEHNIPLSADWMRKISKKLTDKDRESISKIIIPIADTKADSEKVGLDAAAEFSELLKNGATPAYLDRLVSLLPLIPEERRGEYSRRLVRAYYFLSLEEQGEVLTRVATITDPTSLKKLINELIEAGRDSIGCQCVLANIEADGSRGHRFDQIIAKLNSIQDVYDREAAMISIARACPSSVALRALSTLQRIDDVNEQVGAIFVFAPYLRAGLSSETSSYLEDKGWNRKQILTLTRMVSDLSKAIKGGVLDDFVKEAARLSSEWWIVEALTLTLLRLDDKERLWAIVLSIKHITASDLKARLIGRLSLRLARLGHLEESIEAAQRLSSEGDRWIVLADLAGQLATDGMVNEAVRVAEKIYSSEERSKANAAIALHLAARGGIQQANELMESIPISHWRDWVQTRLDLIKDPNATALLRDSKYQQSTTPSNFADVRLDLVRAAAELVLRDVVECSEIQEVSLKADMGNIDDVRKAVTNFWLAEVHNEKTYLEVIAEQPRPLLLKKLQDLAPLLALSFDSSDAEELVSAVEDVAMWWP